MFDTYVHETTREYVTKNVEVKEYKAPTDDSIKLLNEMTDKALENIMKQFSTSNNTLSCKTAIYRNPVSQNEEVLCRFLLNGKEHLIRAEVDGFKCRTLEDAVQSLYKDICGELAKTILEPLWNDLVQIYR